ncbi:endonuclease VII [Mycobacterium phage NiebruSaylor]|nr:endonuclease VII [Mycobacterium phage Vorrps]QOC58444.1 endonuclease VII [Mycobacterium phage Shida]QOC59209.1 endonuclease VII [Mycobacterium phage NiebruSaylor]UAW08361.1 endonuclease VII [Mycobacterium phage Mori]
MKAPECADCIAEGIATWRPIASGTRVKRCATHTRAAKKRARLNAHGRRVESEYGIPQELYWALYEAQGGKCAICQIATGKTKRLAVDHDHKMAVEVCGHDANKGCPRCIRGLLCGPCNQGIGRWSPKALVRALDYRLSPPAHTVIAEWQKRFAEMEPSFTVIVPEEISPSEAFWLWTPFDEETGKLDMPRLEAEGWVQVGGLTEDS